jgi:hypothetical protein
MATLGTAAKLVEVAKKEVGTVEGPKDNETKYGKFTGYNYVAWCGSFVIWCANKAGVSLPGGKATVYTPSGAAAFKKAKAWTDAADAKPKAGDICYMDFPGDGVDRISHVGIVVKDNGDGTVTTIEGNTAGTTGDQRNGGMVLQKVRAYKKNKRGISVSVVGFGRPEFKKPAKPKPEPVVDPAGFPGAPIHPGEVAEYIKTLQKALGLTGKVVDGQYGPVTKKAVIAWQKANPRVANNTEGIITKKQWDRIMKQSGGSASGRSVAL